jgi:hypothetical protein
MSRPPAKRLRRNLFWLALLLLVWLLCSGQAQAGPLGDRLQQFPNWTAPPPTQPASGDLIYPNWMAGTWTMATTLVDLAAPLAPDLVTPGFEGNREFLNQPVTCVIRFVPARPLVQRRFLPQFTAQAAGIVSDRAFNGMNLARAYLGDSAVKAVKVDPQDPNRQVTLLRGDRQLESTVTGRAVEAPNPDTFITSEVFQQVFRGTAQPYFNRVENTTAYYRQLASPNQSSTFAADQVTAIYLSPQDPDYFQAQDTPVALYRYHLIFQPIGHLEK